MEENEPINNRHAHPKEIGGRRKVLARAFLVVTRPGHHAMETIPIATNGRDWNRRIVVCQIISCAFLEILRGSLRHGFVLVLRLVLGSPDDSRRLGAQTVQCVGGAWNAIANTLVSVTTDTVVNAETMADLLRKIAGLGLKGPIYLVLDNARYQYCAVIEALAAQLNIQLMFLPSYSPNLNLIERLWRFVKKKALSGRHYANFADFRGAIDECLAKIDTDHRDALKTLMTHKFQTFEKVSILAA
jgi:transposase